MGGSSPVVRGWRARCWPLPRSASRSAGYRSSATSSGMAMCGRIARRGDAPQMAPPPAPTAMSSSRRRSWTSPWRGRRFAEPSDSICNSPRSRDACAGRGRGTPASGQTGERTPLARGHRARVDRRPAVRNIGKSRIPATALASRNPAAGVGPDPVVGPQPPAPCQSHRSGTHEARRIDRHLARASRASRSRRPPIGVDRSAAGRRPASSSARERHPGGGAGAHGFRAAARDRPASPALLPSAGGTYAA